MRGWRGEGDGATVDGESGNGEGKKEPCHGRCGGKVMELLQMVSVVVGEGKEQCHGRCGDKVMELLQMVSTGMEKGRSHATVAVKIR